jgi:hypothetical protein
MNESPIRWNPPATFDEDAEGLGLPQLEGVEHTLLYDPRPSAGNLDEGGDGRFESLWHGTFNHHTAFVIHEGRYIATWSNHSRDENGAGQRVLGRVGTITDHGIDWGGDETLVEFAPQPVPIERRPMDHDPCVIKPYVNGSLQLINGSLYFRGSLPACHGYTNHEMYRRPFDPIPEECWRDGLRVKDFFFDVWFDMGMDFVQKWDFDGNTVVPVSPMYRITEYTDLVEVTPDRFKVGAPLLPPYTDSVPFDDAPADIRQDVLNGTPKRFIRRAKYREGELWISADGKNALAHEAQFQRPDGKWVVIRDNLLNHGHYYAAMKDHEDDFYPPAYETELYGGAMPAAGELPDGRPWILCNSYDDYFGAKDRSRKDMFITVSDDGITFNKTWLVLHIDRDSDGGVYKFGGPQYFKTTTINGSIYAVYSITKEQIGITKIPENLF